VPIAIGRLERYVADWARKNVRDELPEKMPQGEKVAVIGAGPSD
jgi:glutamate synthase (NADPH/NADH) small chain